MATRMAPTLAWFVADASPAKVTEPWGALRLRGCRRRIHGVDLASSLGDPPRRWTQITQITVHAAGTLSECSVSAVSVAPM